LRSLLSANISYVAQYFSAIIIKDELDTVMDAIKKEEFSDENVKVKINRGTKEITTQYQVDEGQKNELSIRLPPSYPMAEVEIVGTSRVGVNQERWNKWLLTCKIACKVRSAAGEINLSEWNDCRCSEFIREQCEGVLCESQRLFYLLWRAGCG
jgi:hypothetical protein